MLSLAQGKLSTEVWVRAKKTERSKTKFTSACWCFEGCGRDWVLPGPESDSDKEKVQKVKLLSYVPGAEVAKAIIQSQRQ